ncbi:MAG: FAD-binding oxidoreductase [Leptospiraceae bacterium]|nr:FAD-binding oxidoreductase [Leptospiraceae bacterium]
MITIPKSTEKVLSWGMTHKSFCRILKPKSRPQIEEIFKEANANSLKIAFRGGGCSYGDASLNNDGVLIDMSDYNKIIKFDSEQGIITVESGATIKQLWEFGIERGFWPPVVSGTMFPTLGGALSMNIHGKNNFKVGTIGEHVLEFTFLNVEGKFFKCSPMENKELFYAAIGGFGMLGAFLEITIKLKKIHSGKMLVTPKAVSSLKEMIQFFEDNYQSSDYLVGWVDSFGRGKELGRGQIHKADYISEDSNFLEERKLVNQHLPKRLFGIIPKSWMWMLMFPFSHRWGMRLINFAKYTASNLFQKPYKQGHAAFAFLLDYVPNWKFVYKPGSMIQYQVFIPKENGEKALTQILETCQKHSLEPYLAVFKKHKKDPFLMTHSVDGYSMAMDFPVTKSNRKKVWELCYTLDEIVIANGGKFYFAKDSLMRPNVAEKVYTKETIDKFLKIKKQHDPKNLLQTDLYRRIFLS